MAETIERQTNELRERETQDYRAALGAAHELALAYLAGLRDRPVSRRVDAAAIAAALAEPLPERGIAPDAAVREWFERAGPGIVASSGPRFFGFVNGGSVPGAIAGDWLAATIDQNRGLWLGSPAAAETELVVVRWLADLFGLPASWSGTLTSGATMANLVGFAAARQWAASRLGFDAARDGLSGQPQIPVIASTEIHASARKALGTLGLGRDAVRVVPAPGGIIDLDAFAQTLAGIDGPVIVSASAGEVNGGAFDPIDALADRCAAHPGGAWLQVDGAFGLFARLDPSYRHLLDGIERADSVASDAHKWLNVPYDCGFAFVNDEAWQRAAFESDAAYLRAGAGPAADLDHLVPEMSQRFRALAVWCALKSLGRAGYQEIVGRALANARAFAAWIEAQSDLELLAPATLNIVCFRYRPSGLDGPALDAANRQAVAAIQADGRAFVTGTTRDGKAAIRAAFDNWMTQEDDVRLLSEAVRDIGDRLQR
ncbi:MAG TPA: pyridoxal-dependent decarboxylase [Thermomicrobiales bacterium]|nr:pyridoxal-dependent decarboxylase [Thermomicrobiales bacterium]